MTKYWKWDNGVLNLKKARSTIDFHLNKLLKAEIVEKIRVGKEIKYKLKDDRLTYWFLVDNNEALSNKLIDKLLSKGNDCQYTKYFINRALDTIYDIFPHPYHV